MRGPTFWIESLRESINDSLDTEEVQQGIEQEVAELNEQIETLQESFRDELATELRDIVNDSTDLYVMGMEEATYLVDEYLRTEVDAIELPWLEVIEEGDTDD